jgi:hypothetical protein
MGSPGRCLAAATRRAALRSFSHLWPGRHIISAAVYAATLWANSASLHAFSAPGGRTSAPGPGAGPGGSRSSSGRGRCPVRSRGSVAAPHCRTHQQGQGSPAPGSAPPGARGPACARPAPGRTRTASMTRSLARPPTRGRSRTPAGNTTRQAGPHPRHDKHLPIRVPPCRSADVDRSPGSGC